MLLWVYVPAAGRRRTARCTSARGLAAAASSLPRLPAAPRGWGPLLCYQLPALCLGCVMAAWMKLSCLANTSLCVFQCAAVESSNSRQVWHKEQCDSRRPTPPQLDGMRWRTARRSRAAGAWRSVQGSRLYFPTRAVLRIPLDLSPSNRPKTGSPGSAGQSRDAHRLARAAVVQRQIDAAAALLQPRLHAAAAAAPCRRDRRPAQRPPVPVPRQPSRRGLREGFLHSRGRATAAPAAHTGQTNIAV